MARIDFKCEFPCGTRYELEVDSFLTVVKVPDVDELVCPMHGKDCKRR